MQLISEDVCYITIIEIKDADQNRTDIGAIMKLRQKGKIKKMIVSEPRI